MFQRILVLGAVCALFFGAPSVFAQECDSDGAACARKAKASGKTCPESKDCTDRPDCPQGPGMAGAKLADAIAKLEAGEAKGCQTSAAKLIALRKACGAKDNAALKQLVTVYEDSAGAGNDANRATLAEMRAIVLENAARPDTLSVRVAALVKSANAGNEESAAKLASFEESCGVDCSGSIVEVIDEIEASAAGGCRKSAYKLAMLTARFDGRPVPKAPLSVRVAMMEEYAGKGCDVSRKTLDTLGGELGETDSADLVRAIEKLETSAAAGCETCSAKLALLATKTPTLAATKTAKTAENTEKRAASCGATCEDEGASPTPAAAPSDCDGECEGDGGGEDCPPEGCEKPDCCKKKAKGEGNR